MLRRFLGHAGQALALIDPLPLAQEGRVVTPPLVAKSGDGEVRVELQERPLRRARDMQDIGVDKMANALPGASVSALVIVVSVSCSFRLVEANVRRSLPW
jgi:hypothetical protein